MQELIEIVLDIITLFRQITDEREENLSLNVPLHYIKGSKHDSNEKYYELEFDDDELIEMKQIENGADAASTTTSSINVKSTKHTDLLYNMFYFKSIYNKVYNRITRGLTENIFKILGVKLSASSLKILPTFIVNQITAKGLSLKKCITFQRFLQTYNKKMDEPMKEGIDAVYDLFIEFIKNVKFTKLDDPNKTFVIIEANKQKFKNLYNRMLAPVEIKDTDFKELNLIGYFIHREHHMEEMELKECNEKRIKRDPNLKNCCAKSCEICQNRNNTNTSRSMLRHMYPMNFESNEIEVSNEIEESVVKLKDLYKQYDRFSTKILINAFNTSMYGINQVNNIIEEINKTLKILEAHDNQVDVKNGGRNKQMKSRKKRGKTKTKKAQTYRYRKRA